MNEVDVCLWPASAALVAWRRGGVWGHYCRAFSEVARQFVDPKRTLDAGRRYRYGPSFFKQRHRGAIFASMECRAGSSFFLRLGLKYQP